MALARPTLHESIPCSDLGRQVGHHPLHQELESTLEDQFVFSKHRTSMTDFHSFHIQRVIEYDVKVRPIGSDLIEQIIG